LRQRMGDDEERLDESREQVPDSQDSDVADEAA
jgi:hypothetical protein